jgi:hypothetical protein
MLRVPLRRQVSDGFADIVAVQNPKRSEWWTGEGFIFIVAKSV